MVTIAPGVFATPMMAGYPRGDQGLFGGPRAAPARLGRPSEYADLMRHIVANGLLNGEVIRLDGALRMPPR